MSGKFITGHDPRRNTRGRPKGKANKTTDQLRRTVQEFIDHNLQTLQADFDQLDKPIDRLNFVEKMLKHVLPAPLDPILRLNDKGFEELIDRLKKQRNGD